MKIITRPGVRVISAPVFFEHPAYELPPHDNPAENIIATAGKVCYDSYGKDGHPVAQHVINLVGQQHESVLEHANVGLFFEGISRGCSHEIVRHRAGFSYSQRSTRYTREDDAAMVLEPYFAELYERSEGGGDRQMVTALEGELLDRKIESLATSLEAYVGLVQAFDRMSEDARVQQGLPTTTREWRKWVRGKCRQVLPHALETRMVVTANLRAWRHFLVLRTSRHAEPEIRRLAQCVLEVLEPLAPNAFSDLVRTTVGEYVEVRRA